jgi:hypothetical protein
MLAVIADLVVNFPFDCNKRSSQLQLRGLWIFVAIVLEVRAALRRNREAWWD